MSDNWTNNYALIHQGEYISDNIPTIDSFFFKEKEDDKDLLNMMEIKKTILTILNEKTEINMTEEGGYLGDEIDEEEEKRKKEYEKEINEFDKRIKEYINEYQGYQEELTIINDDFKKEYEELQKHAKMVEDMIDFIKKLPKEYREKELIENIINNMNQLCKNIINNEKIRELKEKYLVIRRKSEKILLLIKRLNNFNQTNVCPLCFTNVVDHYYEPCGHTFCKECIQKTFQNFGIETMDIGLNDDVHCSICRLGIRKVNSLYFI